MMKALLMIGGTLVAFAAGMALMYVAVPSFKPELAELARVRADSLAAHALADSSALVAPDTLAAAPDTLTAARTDTLVAALRDSLAAARQAFSLLEKRNAALTADTTALRRRLADLTAQRAEAAQLSKTLTKLEDQALAGVLAQLDLAVLEALFAEASGRNRARLLQALSPDLAARFVRRMMDAPEAVSPTLPDTTATPAATPPPVSAPAPAVAPTTSSF